MNFKNPIRGGSTVCSRVPGHTPEAQWAGYALAERHALLNKREWMFSAITLSMVLLFQSRWNAPVSLLDPSSSVGAMSSMAATGELHRRILGVFLGLVGLYWLYRFTPVPTVVHRFLAPLLAAWSSWASTSVCWSADPLLTTRRVVLFILLLLSAIAFASLQPENIFRAFSGGAIASLIIGIACELYWNAFHPFASEYRFGGAAHPNLQGTTLALGVLGSAGMLVCSQRHRKAILSLLCVCLGGLLLTNSRSAIGALFITCVLGGGLLVARSASRRSRFSHVAILIVLASVALSIVVETFPNTLFVLRNAVSTERDQGNPEQLNGRVDLWETCIRYTRHHLLFGYGYDSFWSANRVEEISNEQGWAINEAHSVYLDEVLSEGLVGASLFISVLLLTLVINLRRFWLGSDQDGIWVLFILFVVIHGFTESIMMPGTSYPAYVIIVCVLRTGFFGRPLFNSQPFPQTMAVPICRASA